MTGRIFDIKRFAIHDGDGIRSTVFFKGCPLRCIWCHNPESISKLIELQYVEKKCVGCGECVSVCPSACHEVAFGIHRLDRRNCTACGKCADVCLGDALSLCGKNVTVDEVAAILMDDYSFYKNSEGGITLSGGECLCQADFCAELLKKMKENGIHTAIDTCGYVDKSSIDKVIPYTDIFLYDIKHMDESAHKRLTGVSNKIILENLKYIDAQGKLIEIRIPFIKGCNDDMTDRAAEFISNLKNVSAVRLLAYNNLAGSKYDIIGKENTMPKSQPPTQSELMSVASVYESKGIKVII